MPHSLRKARHAARECQSSFFHYIRKPSRRRRYHQVTQLLNKPQSSASPNFCLTYRRKPFSYAWLDKVGVEPDRPTLASDFPMTMQFTVSRQSKRQRQCERQGACPNAQAPRTGCGQFLQVALSNIINISTYFPRPG